MDIAILLLDRFESLDAVGPFEVLRNIPGADVTFVARQAGPVRNSSGALAIVADKAIADVTAADILVVPGGFGQSALMDDEQILGWIRAIDATTTWTTSVCTGSLLLAAAGLLQGKKATSHWLALEQLPAYGAEPTLERVVVQGKIVTAAGVSAGIVMALHIVAVIAGDQVAQSIQLGIEYDPQPPFDAGSPRKAPAHIVELLRGMSRHVVPAAE
jgi:putative intracellular protease/amidase